MNKFKNAKAKPRRLSLNTLLLANVGMAAATPLAGAGRSRCVLAPYSSWKETVL